MILNAVKRLADFGQKGIALGMAGLFCYHVGQIAWQVRGGITPNPNVDTTYFAKMKQKVEDDSQKACLPEHRDWYDENDQSYLKDVPHPERVRKAS